MSNLTTSNLRSSDSTTIQIPIEANEMKIIRLITMIEQKALKSVVALQNEV